MKIRLWRGPFDGKVMKSPDAGREIIRIRGVKPMSRKARYVYEMEEYQKGTQYGSGFDLRMPQIEVQYRLCYYPFATPSGVQVIPARHPDGSYFYEYVRNSRKDC